MFSVPLPEITMVNSSPPKRETSAGSAPRDGIEQPLGDGPQELVTGGVAERAIDALESVEVDAKHGHRLAGLAAARQ
jgi:hypothetical protein